MKQTKVAGSNIEAASDKETRVGQLIERLEELYPQAGCELEHRDPFQLLIAVVLSAQTTDKSVNQVTPELFREYPDAASLAAADVNRVEDILRRIGMYRTKAARIIQLADRMEKDHQGRVPGRMEQLIKLPGIGRKSANVVLAEVFGEQRIAVDTHVFRLARRLGLADQPTPEKTELELMEVLPEKRWTFLHHALIHHGRQVCMARKPNCAGCGLQELCPKTGVQITD